MSTPQDPRTTPLQDDEAALARVLRALPAGEPPAALDAAILKAATDAISAPATAKRPRHLPTWALGTAAAAVLAIGIGSQLRPPVPVERAAPPAEPTLQALPAPPPAARRVLDPEAGLVSPFAAPPADASAVATEAAAPADAEANASASAERPEDVPRAAADAVFEAASEPAPAAVTEPAQPPEPAPAPQASPTPTPTPTPALAPAPPPPPAPAAPPAPPPPAAAASDTAAASAAPAEEAPATLDSIEVTGSRIATPPSAGSREADRAAARAAAAERARAEREADDARRQSAGREVRESVEDRAAAAPAEKSGALLPPVAEDARLTPADWLARVRERRDAGDLAGARASLVLFARAHPDATIPDDLAGLRE